MQVPVAVKIRPVVKTPEPKVLIANLPIGRLKTASSLKLHMVKRTLK